MEILDYKHLFYLGVVVIINFIGFFLGQMYIRRLISSDGKFRILTLILMAIGSGCAQWSIVLIGLIGYQDPHTPTFDFVLLGISLLFGSMGLLFTFYNLTLGNKTKANRLIAGLIFSLTIISMHLTGIYSIGHLGQIHFDWFRLLVALCFSIILTLVAPYYIQYAKCMSLRRIRYLALATVCSIVMSILVIGVQYSLLSATTFISDQSNVSFYDGDHKHIALFIGIAALFIFINFLFLVYMDRENMKTSKNLVDEKFKSLFHSTPIMVIEVDEKGVIREVNETLLYLLGYTEEEVKRQYVHFLFMKEQERDIEKALNDAKSDMNSFIEIQIVKKNGELIDFNFIFIPIKNGEKIIGLYLMGRDVSKRNEAFRKQQEIENDMRDLVRNQLCIINKFKKEGSRFVHTLVDGQFLYKVGLVPSDILGKALEELPISSEMYHFHLKQYEKAWNGAEVIYENSINGLNLLSSLKPIVKDGKTVEVVSTIVDITKQKMVEKELLVAKEEADKANRAKSEFLSKLSHELRTPLNGVLGFAQVLDMEPNLTKTQHSHVYEILSAGRHLLKLIDSILDLSRIEAGNLRFEMEEVSVNYVLQQSVKMVEPLAEKMDLKLYFNEQANDPIVWADSTKLRQLFLNLLDNSIKYNKRNGKIFLHTYEENNHICISIKDTGIGIPREDIKKVFDPFYRSGSHKSQIPGAGIGLALVQQILHRFNGTIKLSSNFGEGTQVLVKIPLIHSNNKNEFSLHKEAEKANLTISHCTILYIEDNEMNRELMRNVLNEKNQKLNLLIAPTGKKGLEMFRSMHIDLILLDLGLPDINGLEFIDIIRNEDKSNVPIVVLSANAIKEDIENALKVGCNHYLTKPIDVGELFEVLNYYLRR